MRRTARSEPALLNTRRHVVGEHIGGAIPGYRGFIPGMNVEADVSFNRFTECVQACRGSRTRATYDPIQHRRNGRDEADRRTRSLSTSRAPEHDNRGIAHPFAGDTHHSRIPVTGEEKAHMQHHLGLTSQAHEDCGGFGRLKGYGSATRGIPGFTGYVPGKHAENCFADGWSKMTERSVANHLRAVRKTPKEMALLTEGRTLVAPVPSDMLEEVPIRNPSYQCKTRGWSGCEFSGIEIDYAGRNAPKDRQEGYGGQAPPPSKAKIHGYSGWQPGRVGESVVGERQCKTNDISDHLFKKNRMRFTQR